MGNFKVFRGPGLPELKTVREYTRMDSEIIQELVWLRTRPVWASAITIRMQRTLAFIATNLEWVLSRDGESEPHIDARNHKEHGQTIQITQHSALPARGKRENRGNNSHCTSMLGQRKEKKKCTQPLPFSVET